MIRKTAHVIILKSNSFRLFVKVKVSFMSNSATQDNDGFEMLFCGNFLNNCCCSPQKIKFYHFAIDNQVPGFPAFDPLLTAIWNGRDAASEHVMAQQGMDRIPPEATGLQDSGVEWVGGHIPLLFGRCIFTHCAVCRGCGKGDCYCLR